MYSYIGARSEWRYSHDQHRPCRLASDIGAGRHNPTDFKHSRAKKTLGNARTSNLGPMRISVQFNDQDPITRLSEEAKQPGKGDDPQSSKAVGIEAIQKSHGRDVRGESGTRYSF